jgi:hypothetical protein
MSLVSLALPAFGKTYKSTYPVPCTQLWDAVKDTLANPDNYNVLDTDDAQMNASYNVKHAAHVNVTGAILQRTNHVTLVSKGTGCEMQVVSNFSGWEHNDQGDFKKRVDESLAKPKPTSTLPESALVRAPALGALRGQVEPLVVSFAPLEAAVKIGLRGCYIRI